MSVTLYLRGFNKEIDGIEIIGGIKITGEIKIIDEAIIIGGARTIKKTKEIIINSLVFN